MKPFSTKWPLKLIQITQGVINHHPNSYEAPLARSVRLALRDLPLLKHDEGSVVHPCPTRQTQKKTGKVKVKVSHDRPSWPKGLRVG